ncbi:MAG: 3-deoxy-7-phosphoheptulonate synthase [Bacteroidota bacterium]
MIISVTPNRENELEPLFNFLRKECPHYRYLADQHLIVAPKLSNKPELRSFDIIENITEIDTPYQLASRKWKKQTSFDVQGIPMGAHLFNIIAGPCSVESEEQIFSTAEFLHKLGIKFIRGGAYKPRTSPYSFMGLGKKGLELLSEAAKQYDLRVVTEIMDISLLDEVYKYADVLQVGSRNMQNFYMLNELGKTDKPILLKRGMHAKVTEWLLAAEYLLSGGNEKVILCERGIRSFDPESRNVMDVGVIPLLKELSHLPIIADPSHGTGASSRVESMALASASAGADGLIIEVHPNPKHALSDSAQALSFNQFEHLLLQVKTLLNAFNRESDSTPILKLQTL